MRELFDEVAGHSPLDPREASRQSSRAPLRKRFYTHAGVAEGPDGFAVTLDGKDVPVKLKVFDSLFVPLAKWSMLLTGNYRCITSNEPQSIRDAVHGDLKLSQSIYDHVDGIARRLGADPQDQVPLEKYAKAAESLLKPSSAARAVAAGAPFIERVDLLVKLVSDQLGAPSAEIDRTVQTVDQKLNEKIVAGGSGAG